MSLPRYVCHCRRCGKKFWSNDIVLHASLCIARWLDEKEAEDAS